MQTRRFILFTICSVMTLSLAGLFSSVHAESTTPMDSAHVERIRANCIDAQSSLSRIHASDALLRVNRGQLYESILTRLMAPFNARVSLNRLDGVALVTTAADYERELDQFRASYISYEESLSALLTMNCANQPVAFYDGVADARAKRDIVHNHTINLESMIKAYQASFETLAKTIEVTK
ncbi:MAG: hypothetical protein ABIQ04_03995 [Candidatus Saccharimonadales bacterium]